MAEKIRHSGVVESVEASKLTVRIVQTSACAACGARGLCHAAESKEKLIEVAAPDAQRFVAGQTVTIEGTTRFGLKAVRLAFLYPLVLLIAVMILAGRLTEASEPVCALAGVAAVAAWYIGLSFFRDKLRTAFAFRIVDES
jgi:sigma-E factor negative regulatory protein RseC